MGIQSDRTTHMMKTSLTSCLLLATMTMTSIRGQYSPTSPHGVATNIVNGISNGLVGHGITHGTADIVPASNGVLMGTAKVYPIRPNPLATNNVGSFSVALPDLGTLHVSYKANTARVTASSVTLSMMDPPPSQRLYHKDSRRSLDTKANLSVVTRYQINLSCLFNSFIYFANKYSVNP